MHITAMRAEDFMMSPRLKCGYYAAVSALVLELAVATVRFVTSAVVYKSNR
jgi:hypothetical protein